MKHSEWKIRAILVLFSSTVAALCAGGLFWIVRHFTVDHRSLSERGAEFSNLAELRSALASVDTRNAGRVTLGSIIQPHPSDQMIYDLRPNLSVTFQNAPVNTNSCGMRERELPLVKSVDTYRIAIIGDSFTFGWGVKVEDAFPRQLESILNQLVHDNTTKATLHTQSDSDSARFRRVEVLNFGVPGYSPFQEVAAFEEKALLYQPDAVLLFFIENDFGMPFFIRDIERPGRLSASASGSEAMRQQAASQLPREFDPNHALIRLANRADELGIQSFLAINPKSNWKRLHERLWALRNTRQIRFMSIFPDFERLIVTRKIDKEDLTLVGDQHPTPLKHRMMAEVMAPYFLERLFP